MFTKNSELWDECFKDFDEDTYCGLTVSELMDIYIEWLQAVVEENNTYFVDSKCLPGTTVIGNIHENAKHTKEPWEVIAVDDMYEIYSKTTGHEVVWSIDSVANAQRIVACVNACKGLTNEVLDKGILEDAIALVLNAGKDIGVTWNNVTPYYEGVKVWEEK